MHITILGNTSSEYDDNKSIPMSRRANNETILKNVMGIFR
jgi:hypothetical protein